MKTFALGLLAATTLAASLSPAAHACSNAATTRFACPNLSVLTSYGCEEGEVQCLAIFKLPILEQSSNGGSIAPSMRLSSAVRVMRDGRVIKHTSRAGVSRDVKLGQLTEGQLHQIQVSVDALSGGELSMATRPRCMGGSTTTFLGVRSNHYQQIFAQRAMCNDTILVDAAGHPDRHAIALRKQLQHLDQLATPTP